MFDEIWQRLETLLAKHTTLSPKWRPGVSEDALKAAEEALGFTLPDDYKAFLRRHDGQEEDFGVSVLCAGGRLTPLEQVMEHHEDMREWSDDEFLDQLDDKDRLRGAVFHDKRLVIGGSVYLDGDNTILDFIPGPKGDPGQLIAAVSECDFVLVGTSFTDYLRRVVEGLEGGLLTFRDEDGHIAQLDLTKKENPWDRSEPTIREIAPTL